MRVRSGVIAGVLVLAGLGAAAEGTADQALLEIVRDVAARVGGVRGGALLRAPVAVRAEAAERELLAADRMDALADPARLAARGRSWADLGLSGPDGPARLVSALAGDLDLVGVQLEPVPRILVDPGALSKADFAPADGTGAEVLLATGVRPDEPVLAHAVTHLRQFEREGRDPLAVTSATTDALLAAAGTAEGEATLVAVRFLFRSMGLEDAVLDVDLDPATLLDGRLVPRTLSTETGAVGELLRFVHRDGYDAVSSAFRAGGWAAVERMRAERVTTSDVLHPERAVPAVRPTVPSAADLPTGWRRVDIDALGEAAIVALVAGATGKDNLGLLAADGWRGDVLERWERAGAPDSGVTRWTTLWAEASDAADADYAFGRALAARMADGALIGAGDGRRVATVNGRRHELVRTGTQVRWTVGPPEMIPEPPPRG